MSDATRILIADNDPLFGETLRDLLQLHGYRIVIANGPEEARKILEAGEVDLAILDLRLRSDRDEADRSGLLIAKEVAPEIPKIIQSAFASFQVAREALSGDLDRLPPAVDFVPKEEGLESILTAVEKALSFRRSEEHIPLSPPPDDLIQSCVAGECVLYAGSGLSAQTGLPTWKPFVSDLVEWAWTNRLMTTEFAASLREAIQHGDIDPAADSVVSAIGPNSDMLHAYLKETFFQSPLLVSLPDTHVALRQLHFCAALTTNFDNLLERTFERQDDGIYTPLDIDRLNSALLNRRFFLLKLYGSLTRPDTLLVAPAQYRESISENLRFSRFMESLFFSRTLLFLGASLQGIEAYLSGLEFRGSNPLRQHYALVNLAGHRWRAKADVLQRRFNITVLPYTASAEFPEVDRFIHAVADSVETLRAKTGRSYSLAGEQRNTKLVRLRLENIGPFTDQIFALRGQWNLLLGNNGVGKSTVLKAIAVAVSGEAAKDFAEPLIKQGCPSGSITLDIESEINSRPVVKTYVTRLLRSDTGAEIQTFPTRALETEEWLAIGFPPLRYMNRERRTEQFSARDVPAPSDLLPLISNEPDPRPNRIKEWLFELDHRIQTESNQELKDTASMRVRDAFYGVLSKLTAGLTIGQGRIDLDKGLITVITDDGEVPIESVSQGTVSLIGWIGVILRRLFETFGDDPNPLEQNALILIDEIDAHMHPAWQRYLVSRIRSIFPRVQLIATTHSPLIVPSLLPNEIIRLERDTQTRQVSISVPNYNVQDYRADQILTSPLFGLESSLAPQLEKQVSRYTELAGKDELNAEEQHELERLSYNLYIKLPSPAETAERSCQELWKLI